MNVNEAKLAATAAVFAAGAEACGARGEYHTYLIRGMNDLEFMARATTSADVAASLGHRTLYDVLGLGD